MVTSISLLFAILVTLALEPIGRLGWAATKPPFCSSCVAIPRWVNGCLCAMHKPVVNIIPSMASITRLMSYLLPLPGQIYGVKYALSLIIIHTKKNTRFFRILHKKKAWRPFNPNIA
jgi:Na+/alanine symporter